MIRTPAILAAALVAAGLATASTSASAAPVAGGLALKHAAPATAETVQWGYRRGWYGYRRGWGWGGAAAGLAAGAIIGGAIANSYAPGYYYGYPPPPPGYYPPGGDAVAYCMQRFKSYNPASGTYLGYDGLRHPCP